MLVGGCQCGRVRYALDAPLSWAGHCHCGLCRRLHGAACATWAGVAPGSLRWTGDPGALAAYTSSPGRERLFCRYCGSPIAARHDGAVGELVLASVDGDPGVRPRERIFVASAAPWDRITDDLPRFAQWPGDAAMPTARD